MKKAEAVSIINKLLKDYDPDLKDKAEKECLGQFDKLSNPSKRKATSSFIKILFTGILLKIKRKG